MGCYDENCPKKCEIMENFEKIEQFIAQELSIEERAAFEEELASNELLKEEYQLFQLMKEGIKSAENRKLVAEIQADFLNKQQSQTKQFFLPKYLLKIAAVFMGILMFWAGNYAYNLDVDVVINSHKLSYSEPTMRSTANELAQIEGHYKKKEYELVLKVLKSLKKTDVKSVFLGAMSAFELKDYAKAQEYLSEVAMLDSHKEYKNEINYYSALTVLGQGKISLAYQEFSKLKADKSNPYHVLVDQIFLIKLKILSLKE